MPSSSSSTSAEHYVTEGSNKADHTGYAMAILFVAVFLLLAWLAIFDLMTDSLSEKEVWKAMKTCPPGYTRVLTEKGDLKDCLQNDKLATPVAQERN